MRRNGARRECEFERRALVGIACALVVLHAFLAALALASSLPRAQTDLTFAVCHAGGSASEAPADGQPKPNVLCGLCAHVIAGAALPPSGTIGQVVAAHTAIQHGQITPIRLAAISLHEGRPRAPPATI